MRMKTLVAMVVGAGLVIAAQAAEVRAQDYYARCNIKVIDKGSYVDWVNYRTDKGQTEIKVGTKVKLDGETLTDAKGGTAKLKVGNVDKIVSKSQPDVSGKFAADIKSAVPRRGMTKEQVYMSLCAPAYVDGKTQTKDMSRDEIMKSNFWIWKRMKIGTNIGVKFDETGHADEVQGVWGK